MPSTSDSEDIVRLRLKVGGRSGAIELYRDACPNTIAALLREMPLSCGSLVHARFSGDECSFPIRSPRTHIARENQLSTVKPGDVGYFVESAGICFYYGDVHVISPGNVFGHVSENLDSLFPAFRLSWMVPNIPVRIEIEE